MESNKSNAGLLVMVSIMTAAATISIVLRIWSRIVVHKGNFGLDDWLAFASLPFGLTIQATGMYFCRHGLRMHANELPLAQVENMVKLVYVISPVFDVGITLFKLSTLAFYVKVFGFRRYHSTTSPGIFWQVSFIFVLIVTIAFPIFGIPLFIGVCHPVQRLWNPAIPGHCLWSSHSQVPWAAFNFASDMLILILPMPLLFRLNMRMQRKMLFAVTLAVGYCVPFMSLGRLITLIQEADLLVADPSYALYPLCFWLSAESALGIVMVSLPAIFQLLKRWRKFGASSLFNSRDFSQIARAHAAIAESGNRRLNLRHTEQFDLGRSDGGNMAYIDNGVSSERSDSGDLGLSGHSAVDGGGESSVEMIHVKTKVQVSFES